MNQNTNERVLVTGGDGFLGTNIVRELLSRGYQVRALTEPGRDPATLRDLPVECIGGDIRETAAVVKAAEGCDYLIHTAASTNIWPARSKLLYEINVEGTLSVIRAALAVSVKRLVHIGSANTFGFGTKEAPGDESKPYACSIYGLGYMDTKYEAHQRVLEAVSRNGLPAVIVAPTFMLGPYDTKPGSGRMILAIARGEVPGYTSGGRCFLYVKDAAAGAVNALVKGSAGESYILGNENLTYHEFFDLVARVVGVKPPRRRIPAALSRAVGFLGSAAGILTRSEPKISLPMARISTEYHFYSAAKAVRELGLPQTPVEQAVRAAYDWFCENGYLEVTGRT
ncbi:MAG: NAD-dependent epimerase/dehydratase family protein [Spirochaetales bacterium]|nr:NAD-dependent epimerase/dehydratase family protein [Spirochaetales bacterium]